MNKDQVKNLAHLARISLSDAEVSEYQKDFNDILDYVDQIQKVEVGDTEPEFLNKNIMREDGNEIKSGTHTDDLLAGAPETKDGFYKMKKIL